MEPSLMADFLDRQRRAQAAVAPHAKHLAAERSLRAAATAEPVPPTRWRPPPPRSGPGANKERRDGGRPLVPLDPAQVREEVATDLADRGQRERIDAELTDLHAERVTLRRGTDPSNPATRERIDARQRAIDATAAELTAERAAMRQLGGRRR